MPPTWGCNLKVKLKWKPTDIVKKMQNAFLREYWRRCNTVENIHKVIGSKDRVILDQETKESTACLITKAINNILIFIFLLFSFSTFTTSVRDFFLFLILFHTLEI